MILGQIANPQMADIAGALDIRQKRIDADEKKRRDIRVRQLISEALPGLRDDSPLKQLAQEDTERFVLVTKALGIPLNSGDKMQQLADDVRMLNSLAKSDPRQAFYYAMSLQQERKEQGIESPMIDKFVDQIQTAEDPSSLIRGWEILDKSLNGDKSNKPAELVAFEGMTEGFTDEDKMTAKRIAAGLAPRAVGSGAITTAVTPGLTTSVATSEAEIEGAKTTAKEQAKSGVKQEDLKVKNAKAFESYNTAMSGLEQGLSGTSTGYIQGKLPTFTAKQQIAEGAISAMAPILKDLFRASGEGTFTDYDQKLLLQMIPTRSDEPEARAAKINNINAIVSAKLGLAGDPQQAEEKKFTGQDKQAYDWARSNPDDPRAAAILKKLGVQ